MISCYNAVVRRPHVPREKQLRRIMRSQGIDVEIEPSPPLTRSHSSIPEAEEEPDDDGEWSCWDELESGESEMETDDDEMVSESGYLSYIPSQSMKCFSINTISVILLPMTLASNLILGCIPGNDIEDVSERVEKPPKQATPEAGLLIS